MQLKEAADTCGVELNTLRSWIERGHVRVGLSPGRGIARQLTAVEMGHAIAIAVLVRVGFGVEAASKLAYSAPRLSDA